MKWFYNVLSWHFACLAVALFVLGSTAFTAKVAANSPPPPTTGQVAGYCGCTSSEGQCPGIACANGDVDPACYNAPCYYDNAGGCDC